MANNNSNCADCLQRYAMRKPDAICDNLAQEVCDVRLGCSEDFSEVLSATEDLSFPNGLISDIVVDGGATIQEPLYAVDVTNPSEVDEGLSYSFDRATEIGTETYSLPMRIKIYTPDQEATLNSWKGRKVSIFYKIENRNGEFVWRRIVSTLTAISGALIAGYDLVFDIVDPTSIERPLFVSLGSESATTDALDLITTF